MSEQQKDPNEIGALWEKSNAKGQYFTGTINGERVVVFENRNKRSEKSPDWRVLKAQTKADVPTEHNLNAPVTDDSIPF